MNREKIISSISEKADLSKKDAIKALKAFIETVSEALSKNDKISLVGFGTFGVSKRSSRKGVNPRTLEELTIPAHNVPTFKAGKKLKDAVK